MVRWAARDNDEDDDVEAVLAVATAQTAVQDGDWLPSGGDIP